MRLPPVKVAEEAAAPGGRVRHHLHHHGVGGGDQSAWTERPTEATQLLHRVGVTVIHVHVVISTQRVRLQVEEPEGQHHHAPLRDLEEREFKGSDLIIKPNLDTLGV